MNSKGKLTVFIASISILILTILLGMMLIKRLKPNKEMISLKEYYNIKEDEILVIMQDHVYDKKAKIIDGIIYIDYQTVVDLFNKRMYWDKNENILTYTTPNEIIQAEIGKSEYLLTKNTVKSKVGSEYEIVKVFADQVYVALDFVDQHSAMKYNFYSDSNIVVIEYKWEETLFADVSKAYEIRTDASIKAPILTKVEVGTVLQLVDLNEVPKKGYTKVMTSDGIIGFIKNKAIKDSYAKKINSDFAEPPYTSLSRPGKINLVFHQVFNKDTSRNLEELLRTTKGVTTVSPTWFSIIDNEGNISSLADEKYVEKANQLGVEVWALVDDFSTDISMYEILSHTSSRENLANNIISVISQYDLNGINIDFEKINKETGIHYIQFLRELSVKCRNNGIVLSVDSYVPSSYTEHYNREEQGEIIDYLVVMAYDEHYSGSEIAGPVASINFVEDALDNILKLAPKEKVIMAMPFYTRLWKEEKGQLSAESLAMTPASNVLRDNEVEAEWDSTTAYNYAEFEKNGAKYKMWQEDEKSIEEKLKVIYSGDVAGIAAWKLGLEKESVWNVIQKYLN